jgi:uncharacterized membrane protein
MHAKIQSSSLLKGDRMNTSTVVGLFDYYRNADRAVQALQDYGVDSNHISVVTRDNDTIERGNALGTGAVTGAAAGGLVGLLAGLSALSVPGIGPVIATGALATTLATTFEMTAVGAGFGAATGGLLGSLIDLGFSQEAAEFYTEGVKRGGILVSVEADTEDEDEISDILSGVGAVDMNVRRQTWQNADPTSFEKTEKSDEDAHQR